MKEKENIQPKDEEIKKDKDPEVLLEKQKEYDELWDKYLRLQADFDNFKKRSYKEKSEFIKFANEGLILELVSILDNFERGIKAVEQKKDFDLLHQGVDMISRQLHSLLELKGLSRIKCLGEKFDPHKHEALEIVESKDTEVDMVVDELQPGYTLGGRIIRPAKVKVAKAKEDKEEKEETIDKLEKEEDDDSS